MSKYAMAVVIEVGEQGADAAWEEASERLTGKQSAEAETGVYFLGDPFPIAEQDEYDSGEAARAILAGVAELRSVPVGAVGGPRSEAGAMSTSDGLGADAEIPGAGELRESGWPVDHMSPNQIALAYEAEGDRNHEETDGERRRWEHEIQPFADTLIRVRELAAIPEDASPELMRGRLAVIRGNVPPAVWTLVGD